MMMETGFSEALPVRAPWRIGDPRSLCRSILCRSKDRRSNLYHFCGPSILFLGARRALLAFVKVANSIANLARGAKVAHSLVIPLVKWPRRISEDI